MNPEQFCAWMAEHGYTVQSLAVALDVSPATVQGYRTGICRNTGKPKEIPRTVVLACAALAAGLDEWGDC